VNLGFKALFLDNLNKSAATERCPHPDFHWNMCCGHEYEVAPRLGGPEALKRFVADCKQAGIRAYAWTNNGQALSSPINAAERDEKGWFVRMDDTRLKYGGAYGCVFSILDFKKDPARQYWADSLKKIKETTGLDGYLFDSFYNLGFMAGQLPHRQPQHAMARTAAGLQGTARLRHQFPDRILRPFGSPQHGCPASYAEPENTFACYKITGAFGYTTIPTTDPVSWATKWDACIVSLRTWHRRASVCSTTACALTSCGLRATSRRWQITTRNAPSCTGASCKRTARGAVAGPHRPACDAVEFCRAGD